MYISSIFVQNLVREKKFFPFLNKIITGISGDSAAVFLRLNATGYCKSESLLISDSWGAGDDADIVAPDISVYSFVCQR